MFIRQARLIAEHLVKEMMPFCERAEIAGSIRRGCQDVRDLEIVVIPKWQEKPLGMFPDGGGRTNELLRWATRAELLGDLMWIKTGTAEIVPWQPKAEGKHWRALLKPQRIKLDLFLASAENFGYIFAIRTGHKDFSSGLLAHAKLHTPYQSERSYYEAHPELKGECEGYLVESATGRRVETREERDVFELLGLEYLAPSERTGFEAVRRAHVQHRLASQNRGGLNATSR
ncbi:MAG TPA: hypothetical protein VGV59_03370 [Pyrinomonadaceae bacterium]|nr:hypothetical protein [Pyrinomonadaceae bacterium]